MKKKSPRGIPDFSSKGPRSARSLPDKQLKDAPPPQAGATAPKIKPPSTSQKSGRRGS